MNLTTTISPSRHSRVSRTKKSMFGLPIPTLIMDIGVPKYRPVMVKNPLSENSSNGRGLSSRNSARDRALDGDPTVTCMYYCELSVSQGTREKQARSG